MIREKPASSVGEAHLVGVRPSPMPNPRSADYRKRIALLAEIRSVGEPSSSSAPGAGIPPASKKSQAEGKGESDDEGDGEDEGKAKGRGRRGVRKNRDCASFWAHRAMETYVTARLAGKPVRLGRICS